MSEVSIQRRLRRSLIRAQARLEGGIGDRWIPTIVGFLLSAYIIRLGLDRLAGFGSGVDLAGYSQAVWLIGEGYVPRASMFGTDVHVLELHWSFILYPLGLLGIAFAPAKLLIVTQGMALGLTVVPIWRLARHVANLRVGAASALVLAYALHPATHRLGIDDFHPEVIAVPAIVGLAYFGSTKKWVWYWLCVLVALACRADLGLAVGLWGFVVLGDGERRAGLWTLGVGLIWSLGLLLVAQPLIVGDAGAGTRSGYGGQGLGDVVLQSLRDPVESLRNLVVQDNMLLVVSLLAPVIFLPLLSLRYLLPSLPLAGLYLVTSTAEDAFAERASMLLAFVMISATFALNRLGNMGVDRVFLDVRLLSTLVVAAVMLFASTSLTSPYERPWEWGRLDPIDEAVADAVDKLDEDVPIRASPAALATLAERPWLYPLESDQQPSAVNMGFPAFTRAVLVVESEIPDRTMEDRDAFDRGMSSQQFVQQVADEPNGVYLYVRG